ncbi:hypothetical protein JQ616_17130 [Bradyrhizobium tropiciagri]|uniref:N,N-dimethylformamidase beta subunit family domain-containing protein n=1 Tax=Bradyrhizobium tropiciagri TaxID=312253 RepID=UPI001BABE400|nr:N,N-dimethylformamidase beta subunit family domain-containing protein [Bradyrhizobium tropiciagri]MBR0896689.1 hypothetical protein [Bradyrhizobium tropiciagri]
MHVPKIVGYADRLSVAPGERIEFKVSCEEAGTYHAEVVRLLNGDNNPAGPGTQVEAVESPITGVYPAKAQKIRAGSYVQVDDRGRFALGARGAVHLFVYATLPQAKEQAMVSRWDVVRGAGWWLGLNKGRLELRFGDGISQVAIATADELPARIWYSVTAVWDCSTRTGTVRATAVVNRTNSLLSPMLRHKTHLASGDVRSISVAEAPVLIAASWNSGERSTELHFNGKIDAPKLYARTLEDREIDDLAIGRIVPGAVAHWNFSANISKRGIASDLCLDISASDAHGTAVNLPMRGATGWSWSGEEDRYWSAPDQYGAIHFHDDDVGDAGWETDVTLIVPPSMRSGAYALRVISSSSSDMIPFWVRPPRGTSTADVLLVFPTASYMAYANDHIVTRFPASQLGCGHTPVVSGADFFLNTRPEFGVSTYDVHNDGSGVCYSSRLRPLLTMRPEYRSGVSGSVWQFPADLHIVDWLSKIGVAFDVATDEDLDEEGDQLLSRYKVAITGTHPEYVSENMLNAWENYLSAGGRAMYLGANGFYWVTEFHPKERFAVEIRRGESGVRSWQAAPGEYYHAFSGSRGGLWRHRGRPPQKLFGVGFTAQGFDNAAPYRPLSDWKSPRATAFTVGIENVEIFGAHGLAGEGAAGYELDRYDLSLGTPPDALLLASSDGMHSDNYVHVPEELLINLPTTGGTQDYQVRSDVVYFPTARGGGVFSTGSISWCGALSSNNYNNSVSRLTENVLRRFLDGVALP